ncbi:hypothetical protein, partial [Novacetimonas hansenii]|uniref:hypothetical protein n=1 Tax=Novacetimonas hansenii TaxID=436 RepID=UPI001A7EB4CA
LLKLFRKSFTKNIYDFRMLLILTFQTVSQGFRTGGASSPAPALPFRHKVRGFWAHDSDKS